MMATSTAMESISSEFDYFAPQVVSGGIEEEYDVVVPAKGAVSRSQPLEFSIAGEERVYRDLNNSLLEVTCKVTNADGSDLAGDAPVAPVNLILHSLFKSVDVLVAGKRVNDPTDNYAERAYLETLLTHDSRVLNMRGMCEGWRKDDAERMNSIILTDSVSAKTNVGFVERNSWCRASRPMTFAGRLHSELFHQPLDIPAGVGIEVKLEQNSDRKVLMSASASSFVIKLLSARLLIRSKRLAAPLALSHQVMLNRTNYRIPYIRVNMRRAVLTAGVTSLELNDFHSGPTPSRITLCFVKSTAMSGAYNENPFNFINCNLSELTLKVGSRVLPHEPAAMNFEAKNYTRAYMNTLAALGLDQGERTISLTAEDWRTGYNVHVFKLVPGPISAGIVHPLNAEAVNISVSGKFHDALTENVTVLAYIEQPAVIEIDSFKNVLLA